MQISLVEGESKKEMKQNLNCALHTNIQFSLLARRCNILCVAKHPSLLGF